MISFFCLVEPHRYGETLFFDSRAAAATLDPSIREKLEEKKVSIGGVFRRSARRGRR